MIVLDFTDHYMKYIHCRKTNLKHDPSDLEALKYLGNPGLRSFTSSAF